MPQKAVACVGHAIPYSGVCHVPGASHGTASVLASFDERHCLYLRGQMHTHPSYIQVRESMLHFQGIVQRVES
jgi:hypothetical protein